MKRMIRWSPLVLAAAPLLLVASSLQAAVPLTLTQQGRLFDPAGAPLNATVAVTFAIYDSPSGGQPLWSEVHAITLDEGYFSAQLGETTPFPPSLWDGAARY